MAEPGRAPAGRARGGVAAAEEPGRLFVVCGPPGVGKSTVASAIADRVDGERLRSDVVRKELAGEPRYTGAETQRVYRELLDRGRETVALGRDAVLDGTFRERRYRDRAAEVASTVGTDLTLVRVECAEDVVRERIGGGDRPVSDAGFGDHLALKEAFEPVSMAHHTVDNSGTLAETVAQVSALLG